MFSGDNSEKRKSDDDTTIEDVKRQRLEGRFVNRFKGAWSIFFSELTAQLRNIAHTSTQLLHCRLKFKSFLRTLGFGFLFGLGQSFVRLESVGCIPQLHRINFYALL